MVVIVCAAISTVGSVFLLGAPVMALLLAVGPVLLPEFRDTEAGRLNLRSAGMSLVTVLAVVLRLKQIAEDGLGWAPASSIMAGPGRRRRVRPPATEDLLTLCST
jgi:hypothetical protein